MGRVIILFGFCTAGKSTIIRYFKNKYDDNCLRTIDTDAEISKEYGNHIYNIYTSFYKDMPSYKKDGRSEYNNKDANEYIEKKEREILVKLTDECFESDIPYLIAPGPFLVTRKPQWEYFYYNIKPICYYLELTPEEVYKGLKIRIEKLKCNKISKSISFGCWDDGSITKYESGKYIMLPEEIALQNIKKHMKKPTDKYKEFSDSKRTFSAIKIKNDYDLENKLYKSIEKDLLLKL